MARDRITDKDLDYLCGEINRLTGSPPRPYENVDGKFTAMKGNYHISHAYGGVQVQRIHNEGGGVSTPLGGGYCTKRELYEKLSAYIAGLQDGKDQT